MTKQEEFTKFKEKLETFSRNVHELSDSELSTVTGGANTEEIVTDYPTGTKFIFPYNSTETVKMILEVIDVYSIASVVFYKVEIYDFYTIENRKDSKAIYDGWLKVTIEGIIQEFGLTPYN